jgi:hemolysin III
VTRDPEKKWEQYMDVLSFREPVSAWTHLSWLLLSVPASILLCRRCRGDWVKQVCFAIYGISLVAGYAGSAFYHSVRLPHDVVEGTCQNVDYIGIYLMIAGNITPLAILVLNGAWRRAILMLTWGLATIGIGVRACALYVPRDVSTCVYLGMGWGVLLCYFELRRKLSPSKTRLLLAGGLVYTVGAVMNWMHWPRLWPGIFCQHDLYHLFVMTGTAIHFVFMWRTLAAYRHVPGAVARRPATLVYPSPAPATATVALLDT